MLLYNFSLCYIFNMHVILGKLSDETWVEIENEIIKFKKLSEMPMSSDSDEGNEPQVGHSQSDLFINKQSISDKMIADCIESLIGTYVYVSVNYTCIIFVIFFYSNFVSL